MQIRAAPSCWRTISSKLQIDKLICLAGARLACGHFPSSAPMVWTQTNPLKVETGCATVYFAEVFHAALHPGAGPQCRLHVYGDVGEHCHGDHRWLWRHLPDHPAGESVLCLSCADSIDFSFLSCTQITRYPFWVPLQFGKLMDIVVRKLSDIYACSVPIVANSPGHEGCACVLRSILDSGRPCKPCERGRVPM